MFSVQQVDQGIPLTDYHPRDGDHFCSVWTDPPRDRSAAARFLCDAGEREAALWVQDPLRVHIPVEEDRGGVERARAAVARFGLLASRFLDTPAFALAAFRDWYFPRESALDQHSVMTRWLEQTGAALHGGFAGLRVFAEVDVRSHAELQQLLDYEAQAGDALHELNIIAACLYPRNLLSADTLLRLRASHDSLVPVADSPITMFHAPYVHA